MALLQSNLLQQGLMGINFYEAKKKKKTMPVSEVSEENLRREVCRDNSGDRRG